VRKVGLSETTSTEARRSFRLKVALLGAVQGVGFRPFVHRLATELGLNGWVNNSAQGVRIELEGPRPQLEQFLLRLEVERPLQSFIQSLEASWLDPVGYGGFEIRPSEIHGRKTALVLPDIATCPECLREIFDASNRRYGYPFTNCTHCGPRFSIIETLPYDRAKTSMKGFTMCPRCQAEYDNPQDRRFHAQPNACPDCGPQLDLWDPQDRSVAAGTQPKGCAPQSSSARSRTREILLATADALRTGAIVALKGLGGFHLMTAGHLDDSVRRLRERKHREEKPFALMFPSLAAVGEQCEVSPLEQRLLRSPEAPIVLLRRRQSPSAGYPASSLVAPANPLLGVLLPYTPLHHLLLSLLDFPVVATSGNLSDEPICIDEVEAVERLGKIADLFLVHNRPIVRHVDDSVVREMLDRELVLRRARGYAPLPIQLRSTECRVQNAKPLPKIERPTHILAVGAHLKNTTALAVDHQVFLSQHIGDLESDLAYDAFQRVIADFIRLYEASSAIVAADAHPDYRSTKFARALVEQSLSAARQVSSPAGALNVLVQNSSPKFVTVQHHLAHVLSCMAENELEPPVLGVAWDGTGYGVDGTIWGGEFILVTGGAWERVAHLRPFRLPGGDQAIKEPRRVALGLLHELFGPDAFARTDRPPSNAFSPIELGALKTMLAHKLNSPLTSSIGRLFDAVASLTGLRQVSRFEGQAAMELEFVLAEPQAHQGYPFRLKGAPPTSPQPFGVHALACPAVDQHASQPLGNTLKGAHPTSPEPFGVHALACPAVGPRPLVLDWAPMLAALLSDLDKGVSTAEISARFHHGLAEAMVQVARHVGTERVVLSGGCFQNRRLTELAVQGLHAAGFRPYWHQRVPPNDGGIALGQIIAARNAVEGVDP
jgi:hydrogenase maturation protein HypF